MTRRTRWRPKPTLGQVQAAIAWQAPPRDGDNSDGLTPLERWQILDRNAAGPSQLTDEDRAALDQFAPSKLRGAQKQIPTEQEEHRALAKWIRLQWWAKGARRLESQASRGVREQVQLAAEGGEFLAGNPDWMFFIPCRWHNADPVVYAVELKRRDAGKTRPRDREWWLTDRWPWQERGEVENPRGEHYGLSWAQACALRSMHAAGVLTYVAYGWNDAAQWLEAQIGPRPAVEPDWGW